MTDQKNFDPSISLEDDVALQAIEALEAQSIDPHPKPLIPPTPTEPIAPAVAPPTAVVEPVAAPQPVIEPIAPPVQPPVQPAAPAIAQPAPIPERPTPSDPASKMAAELANAPAKVQSFHFFIDQKRHIKPVPTALAGLGVIALGVSAYFVISML